jgi:hypothetical protein
MSIKRRDFVKAAVAAPLFLSGTSFLTRNIYALAATKKKILFVYVPTGTTKNFWGTSRSSGVLSDAHFGSIATNAGLNTLKEHLIMFNGVSHYQPKTGEPPRDHYEFYAPSGTIPYEYGRFAGMSHVLAGAGGYKKTTSISDLGKRELESIDQFFKKKSKGSLDAKTIEAGYCTRIAAMGINSNLIYHKDSESKWTSRSCPDQPDYTPDWRIEILASHLKSSYEKIKSASPQEAKFFASHQNILKNLGGLSGSKSQTAAATCAPFSFPPTLPKGWQHIKGENRKLVASANKHSIIEGFACHAMEMGILQYGCAHNDFYFDHEYADSGKVYANHHSGSHARSAGFEDTHKCILKDIVDIATAFKGKKSGSKTLLDEVLIFVTSDLGEFSNQHNGVNIPCFLLGGDKDLLNHGQFVDVTGAGASTYGGLAAKARGSYNQLLTSLCHYMGYTDVDHYGIKKEFLGTFKDGSVKGVIEGVFKKNPSSSPNWG